MLLRKVTVRPLREYSERFPAEMPCRLIITLRDGRTLTQEKRDYEGFLLRPMRWETVVQKFEHLSEGRVQASIRREIVDAIAHLETVQVADLMRLLTLSA